MNPGVVLAPMRPVATLLLALVLAPLLSGCMDAGDRTFIGFPTTLRDSGLMQELVDAYAKETRHEVSAVTGGTGRLLAQAARGDLDVVLGHAPQRMQEFADEHALDPPIELMHNQWLVVGPVTDPAGLGAETEQASNDTAVFAGLCAAIRGKEASFATRNDESGTHKEELRQWARADCDMRQVPSNTYLRVGGGQAAALRVADERGTYTLTDSATWSMLRHRGLLSGLQVLHTLEDPNVYLVIQPTHDTQADRFVRWLQDVAPAVILDHALDGRPLFDPSPVLE